MLNLLKLHAVPQTTPAKPPTWSTISSLLPQAINIRTHPAKIRKARTQHIP
jgi:hypothetical protein